MLGQTTHTFSAATAAATITASLHFTDTIFLGVRILSGSPGWSRSLPGSPVGISDFYLSEIDWTSMGLNH
jgi:hypothetical protein